MPDAERRVPYPVLQVPGPRALPPHRPAAPGTPVRVAHEYVRHGALALLAGLDVHTGKVLAATPAAAGIKPFMDLVGQVMAKPGYKNAPRVFVIVDIGSDHRGKAAIDRLRKAHPNAIMVHTLVHASWLNREIFFSVIQKMVVSPKRLRRPGRAVPHPAGLRGPIQPDRPAVQLEVHRQRPHRAAPPHRRARAAASQPDDARDSGHQTMPASWPGYATIALDRCPLEPGDRA